MSRLTMSDLARHIASAHQMQAGEAERFVTALFEIVNDALQQEKTVKVRGLGTFKLTTVKDRESINVNTGERLLIKGRERVTFTPDAALRDLVNRPFSHFETVVVNDGVDFSDIDDVTETDEDEVDAGQPARADEPEIVEPEEKEQTTQPSHPAVETAGQVASTMPDYEALYADMAEKLKLMEEKLMNLAADMKTEAPQADSAMTPQQQTEPQHLMDESGQVQDEDDEEDDRHDDREEVRAASPNWLAVGIAAVALAGLAFGGGYFLGHRTDATSLVAADMPAEIVAPADSFAISPDSVAASPDSLAYGISSDSAVSASPASVAPAKPAVSSNAPKAVEATPEAARPKASPVFNSAKYEAMNAEVRTGAYRIVGVERVIKVRPGQTIRSIAKTYLGEGMGCYISALNEGVTELKAGQELKIPKVELKKKRKK